MVFLMLLLSVYLITVKSNRKLSHYLFAAFILVTAIDFTGLFISEIDNKTLASFKYASVLLQMPLYYLYVKSVCYFNFKLEKKNLLHGLLFLGVWYILSQGTSVISDPFLKVISRMQYYFYIISVFIALRKFKKLYQENYANNHNGTYNWLLQITILFLVGNSFVLLRSLVPSLAKINLIISVFALFVICRFVLMALYRPGVFGGGVDKNIVALASTARLDKDAEENAKRLMSYMETKQPYLDPEISLQKLAEGIALPDKQLSQLINQFIGKHFFDYINEY